ncbi:MAG: MoaD/ThiS family protein [Planctomycetes bacterium]|nr:MoaD/ThiS family protein [Planctomycetota bacterium]
MPRVVFPQVLQRHIACPPVDVEGGTLREALDAACARYPGVRGYLLDDAGELRPHVAIFVDGELSSDRVRLAQPVGAHARIEVFQALSGG